MNVKKTLSVLLMLLAGSLCFAQSSKYLYVNSPEGLRVRDAASLSANRISGLTHMQKVKVVETGPAVTIDGIASNWIRIELPSTSWTSDQPLTGWVFGGYLTATRNESSIAKLDALYTPTNKNTAMVHLDENPDYAPVVRKDFALGPGETMANYAVATSFGKKLFVKQNGVYVWFDNLSPYTTISVSDSEDATYYKTNWCNTDCYVAKADVTRGAIAGFTLKDIAIRSLPEAYAVTGKRYAARQFIAITDLSDTDYAKTTEGYVAKDDIWTNQTDVGILQAFQRDLDVLAMEDDSILKNALLEAMLQKSVGYKETNLFWLEREALSRVWNVTRYLSAYSSDTRPSADLTANLNAAVELEKYFADTADCYFPEKTFFIPACGNYLKGNYTTGIIAVTNSRYKSAFYYDTTAKAVLPLQPYYEIQGEKNLARDLNLIQRAVNAKTDAECDKYLAMVSNSAVASNEAFIGTDKRDRIGPLEPGYGLRLSTKDILHTESKVPVRNNPGTRFKVTGYLEAGTTCTGVQMTGFAIKGWGDSDYYCEWISVDTGSVQGWVRAAELFTYEGYTVGKDYSADMENDWGWVYYGYPWDQEESCVVYSIDGENIPLYAENKDDPDDEVGRPSYTENRAAKPIAYIPNKTVVTASYCQTINEGYGDDSWTVGYLYYVTYGGVSGWLAPENCVVQYYDTPDRKNAYDAWVDYLK